MVLFKTKSDQNNTSKRTRLHRSFQNFLGEHASEPPSIAVAEIIIFLYESSHLLFRILSKCKSKRFNYNMFLKTSPHNKRVAI